MRVSPPVLAFGNFFYCRSTPFGVAFKFFENNSYICRRKVKKTTLSRLYHLLSMEAIGIILLLILAFVFLGLLGWGLKALGWVFEFLQEGCSTSFGCLFWVLVAIVLLLGMITM